MRTGEWEDLSSNPAVQFGSLMESWIADQASRMINVNVFKCPYYLGWKHGGWLTCSKDFHVYDPLDEGGERWAMECKSTSSYGTKKVLGSHLSPDTAPAYAIQCYHQMIVDELDGVYNPVLMIESPAHVKHAVPYLVAGEDPSEIMKEIPHELRVFVIKRDKVACDAIIEYLTKCRELFTAGGSPPSDSSEVLNTFMRGRNRNGLMVEADERTLSKIARIKQLKKESKQLSEEAQYIESELLRALGESSGYTYEGAPQMQVKQRESTRFDSTRFKTEHPDLASEYMKTIVSNNITYRG